MLGLVINDIDGAAYGLAENLVLRVELIFYLLKFSVRQSCCPAYGWQSLICYQNRRAI